MQVINQYKEDNGKYKSVYDVTILINGIPFIHIELKRRGVALQTAFNQINIKGIVFGLEAYYLNLCRYLLYQMELILNIILILHKKII